MLSRKESIVTAAAVGLMVAMLVGISSALVSCESIGAGGAGWFGGSSSRGTLPPNVERSRTTPSTGTSAGTSGTPLVASGTAGSLAPWLQASRIGIDGEPEMRVRIRGAATTLRIALARSSSDASKARPVPAAPVGGALGIGVDVPGSTPAQIVVGIDGAKVTIRGGEFVVQAIGEHRFPTSAPLWMTTVSGQTSLLVDGLEYPGRLKLLARSDVSPSAFDVIEYVLIESYLPGVISKEMLAGWPLASYQVQAVAARSYALQERQRSLAARELYDVDASDRDQMYVGSSGWSRDARVLDAVRSTSGQVLTWRGAVLRAYFSSTCGGRTGAARQTWPTGPGWEFNLDQPIQEAARDHACHSSPLYAWKVKRSKAELVQRLRAFGERNNMLVRKLKDLNSIVPLEVNSAGRPCRYRIVEPGGAWYELSGEQIRLACNTGVNGLPAIERATRVNSSDFELAVQRDGTVVISGRGFGHGVGMCQFCAKGFAERGDDWRTMLARFYPGANLSKLYEPRASEPQRPPPR